MRLSIFTKLILSLFMTFFSTKILAVDIQSAANDVCACLEAPYEVAENAIRDLNSALSTGDQAKLARSQGEMMGVMNAASECFAALPQKYPEINGSEDLQGQVMSLAAKQCPNPADSLR